MSTVLLVLILLGVAGAGYYFYSRSHAAEGGGAFDPESTTLEGLEQERPSDRELDQLEIGDVVAFDGDDWVVRGVMNYQMAAPADDEVSRRALEYMLEMDDVGESADKRVWWLWVQAGGDVALEVRQRMDVEQLDWEVPPEPDKDDDGTEPNAEDSPDELEWQGTQYRLQDAETVERSSRGETPDRSSGNVTYFRFAAAGDDVLFAERAGDVLRAFHGRKVAEYELELLSN